MNKNKYFTFRRNWFMIFGYGLYWLKITPHTKKRGIKLFGHYVTTCVHHSTKYPDQALNVKQ